MRPALTRARFTCALGLLKHLVLGTALENRGERNAPNGLLCNNLSM
jgi:hypothetical protein